MRKSLTALAAATSIAVATVATPTTAEARWGWWGPALGGFAIGAIIGSALARPAYGYYGYGYGYPAYGYYPSAYYGYAPAYYGYYAPGRIITDTTRRDAITATTGRGAFTATMDRGVITHVGVTKNCWLAVTVTAVMRISRRLRLPSANRGLRGADARFSMTSSARASSVGRTSSLGA